MARKQGFSTFRPKLVALAVASCFATSTTLANPTRPTVVNGTAAILQNGNLLQITNSPNAIINWQSFSIGANEITRFVQQSQASAVLNRVTGAAGVIDPSVILGALQSNGRVFLINPSGILFGAGAQIDVAGLVASSLNLSNADFLANRLRFTDGAGAGSVINQGNLNAASGGNVYLVGSSVTNSGVITTPQGEVVLAAGNSVELVNPGTPNLRVEIVAPDNQAVNIGQIVADSGRVGIYAGLINHSGTIRADAAQVTEDGRIVLKATKIANLEAGSVTSASGVKGGSVEIQADVLVNTGGIHADGAQGGSVAVQARNVLSAGRISADGSQGAGGEVNVQASGRILQTSAAHLSADGNAGGGKVTLQAADRVFGSGRLTATGQGAGSTGGEIKVLGNDIVLLGARIDASGDAGGGTILIGGDFQGKSPAVQNAATNWINFSTTINADARNAGDGGKVIVWSDQETKFYGSISARGGAISGDGGFIEVSGKENLVFGGMADAGAPNGKPGTLLLDPKFIVIDSAGSGGLSSFLLVDPNPGAQDQFAQHIVVLANDNVVATDPNDDFAALNAGAVYLFNGTTGALISTLSGSTADNNVGSGGVVALVGNGNYVVASTGWDSATAANVGAVTWGSGTTGISGTVSATNSLVGTTAQDQVGNGSTGFINGVTALSNGNYVVRSVNWDIPAAPGPAVVDVGAVTWGDGSTAGPRLTGAVSAANSLVGTTLNDRIGFISNLSNAIPGVTALSNGNYVVASPFWNNPAVVGSAGLAVGAATWGNGSSAGPRLVGPISAANSLVGTAQNDNVGGNGVTALIGNGNYVVGSQFAGAGFTGAATWGDGTTGISGPVSAANSLVGNSSNDNVGQYVTALANGNYVVSSPQWDNLTTGATNVGAVTWVNGANGFATGATSVGAVVSTANSLVGTTSGDQVGQSNTFSGVVALSNGNYVVASSLWNIPAATSPTVLDVGAVTWGDGSTAGPRLVGAVSAANSLVGTSPSDQIGYTDVTRPGVTALTNGNYVVRSRFWDNVAAAVPNAGAATWGDGSSAGPRLVGSISSSNSLVGTIANSQVAINGVKALSNGNYVVSSGNFDGGTLNNPGAVTWGNGAVGTVGAVTNLNSLFGTASNDNVGVGPGLGDVDGITALTNGNYVVISRLWSGSRGAATWGDGSTAGPRLVGAVSATNSFVGLPGDSVGNVTALANGNYAVSRTGAVTFGNGATGIVGSVSGANANSLLGTPGGGTGGFGSISSLSNGNFVVSSTPATNGAFSAAGLVYVVVPSGGGGFTNPLGFADNAAGTTTITPAAITAITNTGTAVTLQANTDITLAAASDIITNNTGGNGGAITMQAGRSVLLNSNITTDNGNLTITANDPAAQLANRDAGAGGVTMAAGTTLNAGTGKVTLKVDTGVSGAASGNIIAANIIAANIELQQNGRTGGSSILRASGASLLQGTNLLMEIDHGGLASGSSIGTAANPMRVQVSNLEAHTHEASPGIFIDSPTQGLTIGGVPFFTGSVKGVQNVTSGDISITANGTLTTLAGTAGCGATGGTGGPVCANNGNVTLTTMGSIQAGSAITTTGNVTLVANAGSISESGSGAISANSLTTSSVGGTTLNQANTVSSFNATNTSGGNIALTNAGTLNVTGVSQSGGGNVTVGNTGAMSITGAVNGTAVNLSAGGALSDIDLSTTGSISTIGTATATLSAGRDIVLAGAIGAASGSLGLSFNAANQVRTPSGATFTLDGGAGGLTATVNNGKTWQNDGTITMQGASTIRLPNVSGYATFGNTASGVLNVNSTAGWSFISDPSVQGGIISNSGTINVNNSTSWEAAFTNASAGHLNVAASKFVSMQNGQTIAGTVDIGSGATLWVSERHGTNAAFNGTTVTGPGTLQVVAGIGPVADLTNVNASAATLLVGGGGSANILSGTSTFGALNMSGGTLTGAGTLTLNSGFSLTGGSMAGPGTTILGPAVTSSLGGLTVGRNLTNQGTVNLSGTVMTGLLTNSGTVNVNATANASGGIQQSGTLNIASGQTLTVGASGLQLAGGTLLGTGTISGNVNNTAGTVLPGTSPGILTINGNYVQGSSGVLAIDIGGTSAGTQYDQLVVTGTTTLGGTLNAALINNFVPASGNTFTILQSGGPVGGAFAATNLSGLSLAISGTNVNLAATTPAPSPASNPAPVSGVLPRSRIDTISQVLVVAMDQSTTPAPQVVQHIGLEDERKRELHKLPVCN